MTDDVTVKLCVLLVQKDQEDLFSPSLMRMTPSGRRLGLNVIFVVNDLCRNYDL